MGQNMTGLTDDELQLARDGLAAVTIDHRADRTVCHDDCELCDVLYAVRDDVTGEQIRRSDPVTARRSAALAATPAGGLDWL